MHEKKLTKTEVKNLGFSETLIKNLLPEPEEKPNPYSKRAAKMCLWREEDVKAAMSDKRFTDYQEIRVKRQAASKKAVMTKTQRLVDTYVEIANKITITVRPLSEIREEALKAKESWYESNNRYYDDVCYADEYTVNRWMVNYIRHHLTHYDEHLYDLKGKTGKDSAYKDFVVIILEKIAEAYPALKDECDNQILFKQMSA